MEHSLNQDSALSARAHAHWLHELRNAVNTAGVTVALAKRLIAREDADGAQEMLGMAEHAWGRCRDLLSDANRATSFDEARAERMPHGVDERLQHGSQPHQ